MSKGDGHGMSFVYDWQLFTERNREYSHPIGQSKCKTYSIEDYAKGCLYYIKENSCCALNKKTCVCFTDNSKLCEKHVRDTIISQPPRTNDGHYKNNSISSQNSRSTSLIPTKTITLSNHKTHSKDYYPKTFKEQKRYLLKTILHVYVLVVCIMFPAKKVQLVTQDTPSTRERKLVRFFLTENQAQLVWEIIQMHKNEVAYLEIQ